MLVWGPVHPNVTIVAELMTMGTGPARFRFAEFSPRSCLAKRGLESRDEVPD